MGLSSNSACYKVINGQKDIKLSENHMGSRENGSIIKRIHCLLESVSYERVNGLEKRQKN